MKKAKKPSFYLKLFKNWRGLFRKIFQWKNVAGKTILGLVLFVPGYGFAKHESKHEQHIKKICHTVRSELNARKDVNDKKVCAYKGQRTDKLTQLKAEFWKCGNDKKDQVFVYEKDIAKTDLYPQHKTCIIQVDRDGKTVKRTIYRSFKTMVEQEFLSNGQRKLTFSGADGTHLEIFSSRNDKGTLVRTKAFFNGHQVEPKSISHDQLKTLVQGGTIEKPQPMLEERMPANASL